MIEFAYCRITKVKHISVINYLIILDASVLQENNQWRIFDLLTSEDIADVIERSLLLIYARK